MLVNLSVFPLGKGASVSKYVAESLDEIDKSGLDYKMMSDARKLGSK